MKFISRIRDYCEFVKIGHTLFSNGVEIWSPIVSVFLGKLGFNAEPVKH